MPLGWAFRAFPPQIAEIRRKIIDRPGQISPFLTAMALNAPYLPPNPLRPRAFGWKGADGLKKEIPSNNEEKKQGASWLSFFRSLPPGSPGKLAYDKATQGAADLKAAELAFTAEIADQSYRLTAEAFRRHDPNHLVFGERFAGSRLFLPVVERSAKYFPIVAIQLEGDFDAATYRDIHQRTGRPIINADHVANFITPTTQRVLGGALKDEAEAAALYARYLRAAFTEPYFIGYNRCQLASRIFLDGPPAGWKQGILDPAGEPYPLLLKSIITTNREVLEMLYHQ